MRLNVQTVFQKCDIKYSKIVCCETLHYIYLKFVFFCSSALFGFPPYLLKCEFSFISLTIYCSHKNLFFIVEKKVMQHYKLNVCIRIALFCTAKWLDRGVSSHSVGGRGVFSLYFNWQFFFFFSNFFLTLILLINIPRFIRVLYHAIV